MINPHKAIDNVGDEIEMRRALSDAVGKLLESVTETGIKMDETEVMAVFDLADLVTRGRTAVERDFQGNPLFAHALEMPTRLAKQLAQLVRGGLALGMSRQDAMAVAERCAGDTMPPLRPRILGDVGKHSATSTAGAVKRLQLPRKTVDRVLQELHLLGLLTVGSAKAPMGTQWIYTLASDVAVGALGKLARNVSGALREAARVTRPSGARTRNAPNARRRQDHE